MLIKCPDCRNEVSSEALECIHCGFRPIKGGPISTKKTFLEYVGEFFAIIGAVAAVVIGMVILYSLFHFIEKYW